MYAKLTVALASLVLNGTLGRIGDTVSRSWGSGCGGAGSG